MADTYLDGNRMFVDPDAMAGLRKVISTSEDTRTLLDSESHSIVLATKSTATQTFTLPSASVAGRQFTFICAHASGEILINPAGSDTIKIFTFAAIGADADTGAVAPAGGTGIKNTAATNVLGDSVTLVSDGGTGWYGLAPTAGIWASQ